MPNVKPAIGIIQTFRTQKTEIQFALGEYVDNSIDSYFKFKDSLEKINPSFKPFIDITFDSHENIIVIEDNCAGIHKSDEDRAFNIGTVNPHKSDIGTYGMGMKVSSFWFSSNWEVITKPINEKYEKTFKVNLNKILESGKTEDLKIRSDAEPFTKIILRDVYPGRLPKDSRKLSNIQKYLFEMYRFMILEKSITIRFNGRPLKQEMPEIYSKRYIDDKNGKDGDEKVWITKLPAFDLGIAKIKGKKISLKTLGGAAYIKSKGSVKGQKGFSIFWKNRLVDGHAQKPWMPSTNNYDDPELQIYGAVNQYKAQRLEGYIHLCPESRVPSTKDGVDWEGLDEVLIRKLKTYLENATLANENSGEKYNFLKQCEKINILEKDNDVVPDDDNPSDDDVLGGITGKEPGIFIPTPDPDEDDEDQQEFEGDDFFEPNKQNVYSITYLDSRWDVKIRIISKVSEKLYKVTNGPFDDQKGKSKRDLELTINLSHPFIKSHFFQNDLKEERIGIIKFCIALAVAEATAAESPGNKAQSVRLRFLEIINALGLEE